MQRRFHDEHGCSPAVAVTSTDEGRVSVLKATLWKRLTDASDIAALAAPWITLQCSLIAGATRGLVAVVERNETAHAAACWPEGNAAAELLAVAHAAIRQQRGVVE